MSNESVTNIQQSLKSIFEDELAQKFANEWRLADGFTLRQAAHLWVGVEPIEKYSLKNVRLPAGFPAALQMLLAADQMEKMQVIRQYAILERVSEEDFVTRESLKAFAESKREYPAFLFDTTIEQSAAMNEQDGSKTNKGGRPTDYNWDRVIAGLVLLNQDEIIPLTLSETADKMLEFVANGYSFEPSAETTLTPDKSLMEKRLRGIYTQFNSFREKKVE